MALNLKGLSPETRLNLELLWHGYSIICLLFLAGLVVDFALIWVTALSGGTGAVLVVVNRFGEGWQEVTMFFSTFPWLIVTVRSAIRSAYSQTHLIQGSGS